MLSSLILGYSQCQKPINWRANPVEETTDWRARRGKTAYRVRREGTVKAVPYPYHTWYGLRTIRRSTAVPFIRRTDVQTIRRTVVLPVISFQITRYSPCRAH